jgi:hypothetical protein
MCNPSGGRPGVAANCIGGGGGGGGGGGWRNNKSKEGSDFWASIGLCLFELSSASGATT